MTKRYNLSDAVARYIPEIRANIITAYVIITAEGKLKAKKGGGHTPLYRNLKRAERAANNDGDSLVEVTIYLDKEPKFIRKKVV